MNKILLILVFAFFGLVFWFKWEPRKTYFKIAEHYFLKGDFKSAIEYFTTYYKHYPKSPAALKRLAEVYFLLWKRETKKEQALKSYEFFEKYLLEYGKIDAITCRKMGALANFLRKPKECSKWYMKYFEMKKKIHPVVLRFQERGFQVERRERTCFTLEEKSRFQLVNNLLASERVELAKQYFQKLEALIPNSDGLKKSSLLLMKAHIHFFLGEGKNYFETLKILLLEFPAYVPAHFQLGQFFSQKGEYKKAINYLKNASALKGEDAHILSLLAMTYYLAKKNEASLEVLKKMQDNNLMSKESYYLRGVILEKLGKPLLAEKDYKQAFTLSAKTAAGSFEDNLLRRLKKIQTKIASAGNKLPDE
ncbi:tetratricopeptide repeat protein [Candidatus Riflebacteria bacterium]